MLKKIINTNSPMRTILTSYITVIFLGTILLYLPLSQNPESIRASLSDCAFTATSAVCVTGLLTVPIITQWSTFGHLVILFLIQLGALSVITITGFVIIATGHKLSIKNRLLLQNNLGHPHMGGILSMTKNMITGTVICEAVGTLLLTIYFIVVEKMSFVKSVYFAFFHAVSSFCDAGFDILSETGIQDYTGDIFINFIIIALIFTGGIGFLILGDVASRLRKKTRRLSLNTKLALVTTAILILIGTVYFFAIEYSNPNTLGRLTVGEKLLASLFQAVSLGTAGFAPINQQSLREASKFVSALYMIIGGSPGGMAGGIKTVTVAVIFCSIWSVIRDRDEIEVFNRSIPFKSLQKALGLAGIMFILLIIFTTLLCIAEENSAYPHTFTDILYECASALGTVGMTIGITPHLTPIGKGIMIISMLTGRVGPTTIIYALTKAPKHETHTKYPKEDVFIG